MAREDYEKIVHIGNFTDEEAEKEFEFWDKLDLSDYISKHKHLYDLRKELAEKFGGQLLDETGIDCGFNSIDCNDFARYLNNKYDAGFEGVIHWERQ